VQRRLTTVKRLRQDLDARARHRHRALLNDLLADVGDAGAESPIELRYLRDVERAHGLPKGSRQESRSGLPYMSDVDYEDFALIVELDGRTGHEGVGRFRDMDRDNRHALVDATTLRFGHYDLASRPAPLPSRSTVHWQFGATSRCSSAAETASPFQTMTCYSRDCGPPRDRGGLCRVLPAQSAPLPRANGTSRRTVMG
jgi:hypothetical protein